VNAVDDTAVDLGALLLDFGQVERATYHRDGKTHESVTTHTVMLGVLARALAARWYPWMDVGTLLRFAQVHDLPEVYCGDTATLGATPEALAEKQARERRAAHTFTTRYGHAFPDLTNDLTDYESQQTAEARFVRALDKALPKITQIEEGGRAIAEQGLTPAQLRDAHDAQLVAVREYAGEFVELMDFLEGVMRLAESTYRARREPA
jgi:5'-deoxynucleotidase YfbR-like HD superfamily hydrolase